VKNELLRLLVPSAASAKELFFTKDHGTAILAGTCSRGSNSMFAALFLERRAQGGVLIQISGE
jgi:hypothetical protein